MSIRTLFAKVLPRRRDALDAHMSSDPDPMIEAAVRENREAVAQLVRSNRRDQRQSGRVIEVAEEGLRILRGARR